jgi:hypothetical protein
VKDTHDVLAEALARASASGDTGWVNDAGVLLIFDPAPGDIDFKPCTFAVLMHVDASGEVPRIQAFALDAERRCGRELDPNEAIARRVRRHSELIQYCMSAEARERRLAAFRKGEFR